MNFFEIALGLGFLILTFSFSIFILVNCLKMLGWI